MSRSAFPFPGGFRKLDEAEETSAVKLAETKMEYSRVYSKEDNSLISMPNSICTEVVYDEKNICSGRNMRFEWVIKVEIGL